MFQFTFIASVTQTASIQYTTSTTNPSILY